MSSNHGPPQDSREGGSSLIGSEQAGSRRGRIAPGTVLSKRYRVDAELGAGGMAIVYAGHHLLLDEPVAIKVLRRQWMTSETVVARFLREARSASKVRSENSVNILDVDTLESGEVFIVMERLRGEDFAARLERVIKLPYWEAVGLVHQACRAVHAAHELGIIHRDIKPSNLFLCERPNGPPLVKVVDFGIATAHKADDSAPLTLTGDSILGSPRYMAPEQMVNASAVDARADIWSLGCTLYHAITGAPAFDGGTLPEICSAVISVTPVPVVQREPTVPRGLSDVIASAITRDREQRPPTVAAFASAIAPYMEPPASGVAAPQSKPKTQQMPAQASGPNPTIALPPGYTPQARTPAAPAAPAAPASGAPNANSGSAPVVRGWAAPSAAQTWASPQPQVVKPAAPASQRSPLVWVAAVLGVLALCIASVAIYALVTRDPGGRRARGKRAQSETSDERPGPRQRPSPPTSTPVAPAPTPTPTDDAPPSPPQVDWSKRVVPELTVEMLKQRLEKKGYSGIQATPETWPDQKKITGHAKKGPCMHSFVYIVFDDPKLGPAAAKLYNEKFPGVRSLSTDNRVLMAQSRVLSDLKIIHPGCSDTLAADITR